MSLEQDLEEALKEIGGHIVRAITPLMLFSLPDERGGLLFKDHTEARKSQHALDNLIKAMENFKAAERRLADQQRLMINWAVAEPEDYETGKLDNHLRMIFDKFSLSISMVKDETEREIKECWSKRRRPTVHRAYRVAAKLAEFYVLGKGEVPVYTENRDPPEPTSLYGKTTRRVFDLLRITSLTRRPCKAAIGGLTDQRIVELLALRKEGLALATGRKVKISIVTGRLRK